MRQLSTQDTLILSGLTLGALVLGTLLGAIGWCLFGAAVIWGIIQQAELKRLTAWSVRPITRPSNQLDSWHAASNPAYQYIKRERSRSQSFLQRLRELSTLSAAIPDAAILVGTLGEIQDFNPAAKKLLRLTNRDRGLGLATVVRQPEFVRFLRDGKEDEQIEIRSPFVAERTLEARRFQVDGGRIIVLVRDITELNRLLTMRQDFVANVSHELRTPLTVIGGYLETMTDTDESDSTRLALTERLHSPLRRMQSLVEDLLLLSRLESTPAPTDLVAVPMRALVERALREAQGLADERFQLVSDVQSSACITGVESELYSVCINLLTNALRYSPDGGAITISLTDLPDRNSPAVLLSVTDNGIGIAPEHLSRLTERFYRVDLAGSRTRGGTGLGLAIVKHVLRRHDTSLKIDSTLGEGSSFSCEFAATLPQSIHQMNGASERTTHAPSNQSSQIFQKEN